MSGDARMWRCMSCFYKSPRAFCYGCNVAMHRMEPDAKAATPVVACLDCGFTSNVPALIAAHDFGHTEYT